MACGDHVSFAWSVPSDWADWSLLQILYFSLPSPLDTSEHLIPIQGVVTHPSYDVSFLRNLPSLLTWAEPSQVPGTTTTWPCWSSASPPSPRCCPSARLVWSGRPAGPGPPLTTATGATPGPRAGAAPTQPSPPSPPSSGRPSWCRCPGTSAGSSWGSPG